MEKPKFNIDDTVRILGDEDSGVWGIDRIVKCPAGGWNCYLSEPSGKTRMVDEDRLERATLAEYFEQPDNPFEEISNRLDVIAKMVQRLSKEHTQKKKSPDPDRIQVPENIKFYYFRYNDRGRQNFSLASPNGKLLLHQYSRLPHIDQPENPYAYPVEGEVFLVQYRRRDLKPGDIAFVQLLLPDAQLDIGNISQYSVILNDKEHAYWAEKMDMRINGTYGSWFKVIFEE